MPGEEEPEEEEPEEGPAEEKPEEEERAEEKPEEEEPEETANETRKYPYSVFFIIGNEFCERFSYYGMRTILTMYATTILLYSEDSATALFHAFVVGCYFTPIFGAILADSYWGKFKTIFYISIIYCTGNIIISVGAIPAPLNIMRISTVIGLVLIAIGTGGIKPCVSAFGGDQFHPGQERYLQQFFSLFYLSINLGGLLSTYFTPVLRSQVLCFGQESCFSLAFAVPAILMITALIIFLLGKPMYRIIPPAEGNIILQVCKCIFHALVGKCQRRRREVRKTHWLDYAQDKYDENFLQDVKILLHVLFMYIPLPMFWALFDQQGSRWTLQATRMNGYISENYQLTPEQMQFINPLGIVLFIPLFEYCIYPLTRKCHVLEKPLQRITTGGLLAAFAFVLAGSLEMRIQQDMPAPIKPGLGEVVVVNNSPCEMVLSGSFEVQLPPFESDFVKNIPTGNKYNWTFVPQNCFGISEPKTSTLLSKDPFESMMVTVDADQVKVVKVGDLKEKSRTGYPLVRIFFRLNYVPKRNRATFRLQSPNGRNFFFSPSVMEGPSVGVTEDKEMLPSKYEIYLQVNQSNHEEYSIGSIFAGWGGKYIISVFQEKKSSLATKQLFKTVKPSTVSILWQIPQYLVITAGEIMFSITGLEFSYSQAPISMKSVLQAAYLLTVAIGDCVVIIVAEAKFLQTRADEFFLFAALMVIDMIVFAIFSYFYKYVTLQDYKDDVPES